MPITTKVVSSNPVYGEVYPIQHYVAKCVSGFMRVLRFPSPTKLTDVAEILLKVALSANKPKPIGFLFPVLYA